MTPPPVPNRIAPSAPDEELDLLVQNISTLAKDVKAPASVSDDLGALSNASKILGLSGRWTLIGDVVALLASFLCGGIAAWAINVFILTGSFQDLISRYTIQEFAMFAGLGLVALMWLDNKGHYRNRLPHWEIVGHIVVVAMAGLIIGGFVQFALKSALSRLWLGLGWTFFAMFLFATRSIVRHSLNHRGLWKVPVLLVGQGQTAEAAVEALRREHGMGFDIRKQIPAEAMADYTKPRSWKHLMLSSGTSYLLLALEGNEFERYQASMQVILRERLAYSIVPPWLGLPSSTLAPHYFMMHDVMLLHDTNRLNLPVPRMLKRSFDIVFSGLGILVLLPVFAVLAAKLYVDEGPVLFRQKRVGRHGRLFTCYKFRSMRVDADAVLQHYLDANPEDAAEWKKYQKLKHDPRITKFGDFIRRTSLDELPQLFNVLIGDMSLVGPRPIMQGQEIFYEGDITSYESVLPGITGPWQVSGRSRLTFKQRVALEVWYARNWSLWLDIVILLKTIPILLKKDQAY